MAFQFLRRKKFWKRFVTFTVVTPIVLFTTVVLIAYYKQDAIVQELISSANEDFEGTIKVKGSHIAPFANFPHVSIDLEELELYEGKTIDKKSRIIHFKDCYIGFNIWDIIAGNYEVKSIELDNGDLRIVQHKDGNLNITKALASKKPAKEVKSDLHLDLKSIELNKIDISKYNEANGLKVDAFVDYANSSFKTHADGTDAELSSEFVVSIVQNGDSTFIKQKHFEVDTEIKINDLTQMLHVDDTEIKLEKSTFRFSGDVGLTKDAELDLHFSGDKPNFDLFIALAPPELIPTLEQFDNKGRIYFNATVKGKAGNGNSPQINARFGCKNGFFNNLESNKKLNSIAFSGTFSNGEKRDLSTMKFELNNFTAKPEAGIFSGNLSVENFEEPNIKMKLHSDFDLDFLSKFINSKELKGLKGKVQLTMNFRDIIDLDHPEKSIERLNESYFSKLDVKNLQFQVPNSPLDIRDLDIDAALKGHKAVIENFSVKIGKSDVAFNGFVSDLPAIIHHTGIEVETDLNIRSHFIDIEELTSTEKNKGVDEQIENLRMNLKFVSSAKAISESPSLPIGEFFIDDLYAKMKHYPHTLHDFHADLFVDDNDFRIVDFSGMVDKSDFHFTGRLDNYNLWFDEKMRGDTKVEFDLTSKHLQFDNLFSYGGENYVPEDYRHEIANDLKLHGTTALHFKEELNSIDLSLTELSTKLQVHPVKFEQFKGRVHIENEFLNVQKLHGKIGQSIFTLDLGYHYGENGGDKQNHLELNAPHLNFDELMNYHETTAKNNVKSEQKVNHDAVFSIYDFEFPNMRFKLDIGHLNYHKYLLNQFKGDLRTEKNHMLYIDKLNFDAAGGHFNMDGYFSGKDKQHIYFKPTIKISHVDLDKFMVKFDNFGQDHLVSENLHGKFSGTLTGKIHMHADLVPKIDDSDLTIHMSVLNGRLENYGPILAMSDYFQDKNLSKVAFDTLTNTLRLHKGILEIPTMTINSTLGFMEVTGTQHILGKMDMDYLIGVPWKMVGEIAAQRLFKKRKEEVTEDEIQYRDEKSRMIYIKMTGDMENYNIQLSKKPKRKK